MVGPFGNGDGIFQAVKGMQQHALHQGTEQRIGKVAELAAPAQEQLQTLGFLAGKVSDCAAVRGG